MRQTYCYGIPLQWYECFYCQNCGCSFGSCLCSTSPVFWLTIRYKNTSWHSPQWCQCSTFFSTTQLQACNDTPARRNIFCPRQEYHILNKLSWYLRYNHICINKHGKVLSSISPYALQFSEQTHKKNPCWAVFRVIFKMADTANACMLPTRLVSCKDF